MRNTAKFDEKYSKLLRIFVIFRKFRVFREKNEWCHEWFHEWLIALSNLTPDSSTTNGDKLVFFQLFVSGCDMAGCREGFV